MTQSYSTAESARAFIANVADQIRSAVETFQDLLGISPKTAIPVKQESPNRNAPRIQR
jgi:outer membrane protein TolC